MSRLGNAGYIHLFDELRDCRDNRGDDACGRLIGGQRVMHLLGESCWTH